MKKIIIVVAALFAFAAFADGAATENNAAAGNAMESAPAKTETATPAAKTEKKAKKHGAKKTKKTENTETNTEAK